ncbi:MAG: Fe-S protein assembly chaperone HscA [Phycisphaeraceae bacterium]|nr:Fe-S protein assembly chaperone HscA [Phycisphaeraceae bacterium]
MTTPSKPAGAAEPGADPIVGIDLGTTYSLVAVAGWPTPTEPPRVLTDDQGRALLPSIVRYLPGRREVEIGWPARAAAQEHPAWTIASVKRLMGRARADAEADLKYLPYAVVEGPNQTARVHLPDGRAVSPQEVSAHVLAELRRRASAALGVEVRRAVVTVPAYFDDAQRQATRDAGRLAGLDVLRIVNEPTAAALAYGLGLRAERSARLFAVYDLGGGTFDVSVLRLTPGQDAASPDAFEVLSTAGDTHLGGDDFDHALAEVLGNQARAQGCDATGDPRLRRALLEAAERVKIELSKAESATARVDLGQGRTLERTVERAEFEALIAPLVDRTFAACRRAMRDASRRAEGAPLSAVVMVGGSTRVPLVRQRAAEFFGLEPYTALDPDRVVALGAAVQGSILSGANRGSLLLDVVPLSLGVETVGGAMAKLIMRGSPAPARATERFSTSVDGQTAVRLNVLQGEREMAADCRSLGTFTLAGIPPMPAGVPRLVVELLVDANGVLSVSAVEERSGKRASLQVVPNHGLTREEVERIERESFEHAREDMTRHRVADLIANGKLDLHWVSRQYDRHAPGLLPERRARLDASIARLRELLDAAQRDWRSVDAEALHQAKESLDRASVPLHEAAIAASLRDERA